MRPLVRRSQLVRLIGWVCVALDTLDQLNPGGEPWDICVACATSGRTTFSSVLCQDFEVLRVMAAQVSR